MELIGRCVASIAEVGGQKAGYVAKVGCTEIYAYWKHWICVFPQHGPGRKHLRSVRLQRWQSRLVERYPREFVAGLIHSDGCRAMNRVWEGRYEYPRYLFSNRSAEIRDLFVRACASIGVECRANNWFSLSVARRRSVAILDEFIGPKS